MGESLIIITCVGFVSSVLLALLCFFSRPVWARGISVWKWFVALGVGVVLGTVVAFFSWSPFAAVQYSSVAVVGCVTILTDLCVMKIPKRSQYFGMLFVVLSFVGQVIYQGGVDVFMMFRLVGAGVGVGIALLLLLVVCVSSRYSSAVGGGDIRMLAFYGMALPFTALVWAYIVSAVLSVVVALVTRSTRIAYGIPMSVAAIVCVGVASFKLIGL